MKNILVETNFQNVITETSGDKKKLYIKGIFMESEKPNGNGRTYRYNDISEAVKLANDKAKAGRHILGELDHPTPSSLIVRLENVSHKLIEMHMDGNNAVGKAEILPTPKGLIAKSLIESGVQLGVSSRGHGDVIESADGDVVEGYNMVTVDLVATPSANEAYPSSIYEHLDHYKRGGIVHELAVAIQYDESAQKYFREELTKFIKEKFNN